MLARNPHSAATPLPWHQVSLNKDSLRYLVIYLAIQTAILTAFIAAFHFAWQFDLPGRLIAVFLPLQLILVLLAVRVLVKVQFIKSGHFLASLFIAVFMLAWFLHDSGGHTNPLISLLLVPLAMSAVMLGWQASVMLALVVVALYAGLMHFFVPLTDATMAGHSHHGGDQMMQLHLFGMWLTFCLSVLLILVLVIPLATSIRRQRETIAQQREQSLRDERIVAMATFAASAAHQLGTPLSTLSVITEDLAEECQADSRMKEDLKVMAEQIDHCKATLHGLMRRADAIRNQEQEIVELSAFLAQVKGQFNLLNPSYSLDVSAEIPQNVLIYSDETLQQAVLNLLDNAVKASKANPSVAAQDAGKEICIRITDRGPGIAEEIQESLGQPYVSTREQQEGMGLGLFLSNSTINRMGGRLKLVPGSSGTVTEVWLPKAETAGGGKG